MIFIDIWFFLSSKTLQSLLHDWPNDISNELLRLGRTVAAFAFAKSSCDRGLILLEVNLMGSLFGRVTEMFVFGLAL